MGAVDLLVPGDPDSLTGGYIYDRRIFEGLRALGWQARVHALSDRFPEPAPADLAAADAVLDTLPDGRRVLIDGLALAGLTPLLHQHGRRLRLVALIHHPLGLETGLDAARSRQLEALERAALAAVPRVIVTSPWTRRELGRLGVAAERIDIVEPGIDRPAAAAAYPAPAGEPLRLLTVGTVTPRKAHALLLEALAGIADRAWALRCAGSLRRDPATSAALGDQILRLGLRRRVSLLGELEPAAVAAEYAAAHLFVLPSYLEGYGMAIAEAVAHGLPVVSTAAGAIPDTLPAGTGVLVPPGDAAALGRALAGLMDEPERLRKLAAAAAAAGPRLPSWAEASARFAAVLDAMALG